MNKITAERLFSSLQKKGIKPKNIYISSMPRALETGNIIYIHIKYSVIKILSKH